ncbi:hypothetical protein EVAR_18771_1 [Eumeta japonica]|uniref:Uncharacterized protein n=1 Tax=Eumeta variegata TaxID=151549 RepID=A0A4C1UNL0_EUMVA|nr:hypothetical protein EVAR_18771_1 [Eumeta japonica]
MLENPKLNPNIITGAARAHHGRAALASLENVSDLHDILPVITCAARTIDLNLRAFLAKTAADDVMTNVCIARQHAVHYARALHCWPTPQRATDPDRCKGGLQQIEGGRRIQIEAFVK